MAYRPFSNLGGAEVLDEMDRQVEKVAAHLCCLEIGSSVQRLADSDSSIDRCTDTPAVQLG